jgi:hypothetical protein
VKLLYQSSCRRKRIRKRSTKKKEQKEQNEQNEKEMKESVEKPSTLSMTLVSSTTEQNKKRKRENTIEQSENTKEQKRVKTEENSLSTSSQHKQKKSPKPNAPFRRIDPSKITLPDTDIRFQDNSYIAKGVETYALKAYNDLKNLRGDRFRHEKTKKKKSGYKGGRIPITVNSALFEDASSSSSESS